MEGGEDDAQPHRRTRSQRHPEARSERGRVNAQGTNAVNRTVNRDGSYGAHGLQAIDFVWWVYTDSNRGPAD